MALPPITPYRLPAAAELPPTRVDWKLDTGRAALLVHDMQRYFMAAYDVDAEPIRTLLVHIAAIRAACDEAKVPVFYTAQPVKQDPVERGLQRDFWGPGMQLDPEHRAIVDALAPGPAHTVLTKWRYSAFERSDFAERLAAAGRDQLIVTGVFAHIGCLATTFGAFTRDIQPFYVADAVADFSREKHDMAVAIAAGCCAKVTVTEQIVSDREWLRASDGGRLAPGKAAGHGRPTAFEDRRQMDHHD